MNDTASAVVTRAVDARGWELVIVMCAVVVLALTSLGGALAVGVALGRASARRARRRRGDDLASVVRRLADETAEGSVLANGATLRRVIGHLPKWIKYSDCDRVPWLNKAARQMWPMLDKAIAKSVIEALEPTLNDLARTSGLSLNFKKFTCGVEPPILASVKVSTESEGEVILDIEFKWAAKDDSIVLDVSTLGIKLPIEMSNVEAYGTLRLVFGPLVPWWPSFSALKIAFVDKPAIDFSLKLIGGDITAVPIVANMLRDLIKNQLVDLMVWPARLWCAVSEWQPDDVASSSGLLRITIHSATNLPAKPLGMPAKPAVQLSLTHKTDVRRQTSIKRGADPVWEETFEFTVADIHSAKLRINVVDTRVTTSSVIGATLRAPGAMMMNRSNARVMSSKFEGEMSTVNKPSIAAAVCDVSMCHDSPGQSIPLQVALSKEGNKLSALNLAAAPLVLGASLAKRAVSMGQGPSSPRGEQGQGFNAPEGPMMHISVSYHPFKKKDQTQAELGPSHATTASDEPKKAQMMEQFSGVLYVRLLRGENLAGVGDAPDPFVKMRMNRQKRKSSTKIATRQPVWEEEFEFIIGKEELENSSNIILEVWDRDAFGVKTSLGHLELDTRAVLSRCTLMGTPVEEEFELTNTPSGALTFEFEFLSILLHPEVKEEVASEADQLLARKKSLEKKPNLFNRMFHRHRRTGSSGKSSIKEEDTMYGTPISKQTRSITVPHYDEGRDSPLLITPRSPKREGRGRSRFATEVVQDPPAPPAPLPEVSAAVNKKPGAMRSFGKKMRSLARSTGRALSISKPDVGGNRPVKEAKHELLSPRRQPTRAAEIVPGLGWRQRGITELRTEKTVDAFETPRKPIHARSISVPEVFMTPNTFELSPEAVPKNETHAVEATDFSTPVDVAVPETAVDR